MTASTPEHRARDTIDTALQDAGWVVQDRDEMNVYAGRGVAVREFVMAPGHGFSDYLLFVEQKPVGVVEAKPTGHTLIGVEPQAGKYSEGLPRHLKAPVLPLPFQYVSTGAVSRFTNLLDPEPRSRDVFSFHQPATLSEWLAAEPLGQWIRGWSGEKIIAEAAVRGGAWAARPSTLRARLHVLPDLEPRSLWPNQIEAVENLERSLAENRPRALVQMVTGSGKTTFAVTSIYRLIKYAGARRVLFLVDRGNLGRQAELEFGNYRTPNDWRKFTDLYNVQRLTSNTVATSSKVVVTTIQRLYSMLRGEEDLDPELEEGSVFDQGTPLPRDPVAVAYNAAIPPEYFDIIFIDECHRSIYSVWRQVLEYFDAFLIGLTATPAKHTFGFFNGNLVMEYSHERAVADGVNVDFEIYRIRTRITEQGATIEAGPATMIGVRDRRTGRLRWERPDDDVSYAPEDLDRQVVAPDQIRTVVRTFKERLFTEIFPGRTEMPKTLIFAKDDRHAEDIVGIVREEFGRGNDFCTKITYKTTGRKPDELIQEFRTAYNPRIAVTVDMIATGTDIRPIEIVMFMRAVQSRVLFEQMKGRGVRIVDADTLRSVTPDARTKTHFVIVDCVGVTETELADTQPLERQRSVSFGTLLERAAAGSTDLELASSLLSRLSRLDRQCGPDERERIAEVSGGLSLRTICDGLVTALDLDRQLAAAREAFGLPGDEQPTDRQLEEAGESLVREALLPLASNPSLRRLLQEVKQQFEQIIDVVSIDELLHAGRSEEAERKAREMTQSFEHYLADNREEIEALGFYYSQPYARRPRYRDIKTLADAIGAPPRRWTADQLWRAYALLERDKVHGASGQRLLADIVSLVRFALHQDDELVPYRDGVQARFEDWMAQQAQHGRRFTPEQVRWLEMIRDHIAASAEFGLDDFDYTPFVEAGGLGAARQAFGVELPEVMREMNEVLAA